MNITIQPRLTGSTIHGIISLIGVPVMLLIGTIPGMRQDSALESALVLDGGIALCTSDSVIPTILIILTGVTPIMATDTEVTAGIADMVGITLAEDIAAMARIR